MAKKDKSEKVVADSQSLWDGRLLTLIGTELLMYLVIILFAGAGAGIAYAIGAFNPEAEPMMLIIGIVAIAVLAVIGFCWASVIWIKWDTKHTVISGQRLSFNANTFNLFFNVLKWLILTVITVGIYGLWLPIKVRKWQIAHTVSIPEADENGLSAPQVTYYYED